MSLTINRVHRLDSVHTLSSLVTGHLNVLPCEFESYFDNALLDVTWYRDPFNAEIDLTENEAEKLAEIKISNTMKLTFNKRKNISSFRLYVQDAYLLLSKKAPAKLI